MSARLDLIVVGSGVAASAVVEPCRTAGWSIAIVDHKPFGGTCALRGCDPKKVLVGAAEALDLARRMAGHGLSPEGPRGDWPSLMAFKRTFTAPVPEARAAHYRDAGIQAYRGHARFTGETSLAVDGETLEGRFIVLANGAVPRPMDIPGAEHLLTSDDVLELDALPRRLVLVGGGYIAFEVAHVARRFGAEVTMLQRGPRLLKPFDSDLVDRLAAKTRRLGVDIRLETQVDAIEATAEGVVVHATDRDGACRFAADAAVHAAGRVPALAGLDVEAAGLATDKGRLVLDPHLRSPSNPAVLAAGDGAAVAATLLGTPTRPDYTGLPSCVFSIPPLATVGISEATARNQDLDVRICGGDMSGWFPVRRVNEDAAAWKVIIDATTDEILGAHVLGPDAAEVINLFGLAMRQGLTAGQLRAMPFAYPTMGTLVPAMLSG